MHYQSSVKKAVSNYLVMAEQSIKLL